MVKHGTNKKRRAGRTGKTKLKNRTFHRWNPNPRFTDNTVREMWDASKSPAANLASMGLLAKPNQDAHRTQDAVVGDKGVNVVELFDIPDSDNMVRKERPLASDDQKYIAKCLGKYGDDYGRIFRDHKLNYMQHTEGQLRKMGARFLLLSTEQRVIDMPSKVQALAQE